MLGVITLLNSPLGRILGVLVLVGATYLAGLYKGYQWASNSQEIATLRETVKVQEKRIKDYQALAYAANERADVLDRSILEFDSKIEDYKNELAKRPPSNACLPSDDDLRRLRDAARPSPKAPAANPSPGLW